MDDRSYKEELRCVGRLINSASIADRKKAPRNRSKAVAAPTDEAVRCQVRLGLRCSMEYCHLADEDLIASIEAQNTESFATLYDRHSRVAYSLAYRMMGEHQAAEDLVQEAFLKVWRAAGSYRAERGSARTWVLSIVHNHGIDQLRSTARSRKIQDRAEATLPTSQPSEAFA